MRERGTEFLTYRSSDSVMASCYRAAPFSHTFVSGCGSALLSAGNKSHGSSHWVDNACDDSFARERIES